VKSWNALEAAIASPLLAAIAATKDPAIEASQPRRPLSPVLAIRSSVADGLGDSAGAVAVGANLAVLEAPGAGARPAGVFGGLRHVVRLGYRGCLDRWWLILAWHAGSAAIRAPSRSQVAGVACVSTVVEPLGGHGAGTLDLQPVA
jgi:hypothetical protein